MYDHEPFYDEQRILELPIQDSNPADLRKACVAIGSRNYDVLEYQRYYGNIITFYTYETSMHFLKKGGLVNSNINGPRCVASI